MKTFGHLAIRVIRHRYRDAVQNDTCRKALHLSPFRCLKFALELMASILEMVGNVIGSASRKALCNTGDARDFFVKSDTCFSAVKPEELVPRRMEYLILLPIGHRA